MHHPISGLDVISEYSLNSHVVVVKKAVDGPSSWQISVAPGGALSWLPKIVANWIKRTFRCTLDK